MNGTENPCQREDDAFAAYIDFAIALQGLMGNEAAEAYLAARGVPNTVIERVLHPKEGTDRRTPRQSIGLV